MQKTERSDRFLQLVQPCLCAEEERQRRIRAFPPLAGKRKRGVWRDEVVKRSKKNRANAIVIFTGAKTRLFSEEEGQSVKPSRDFRL